MVHIARRARQLFPRRLVRVGFVVWVSTSALAVWTNLRSGDDPIAKRRTRAIRQLYVHFARRYRRQLGLGLLTAFAGRATYAATLASIGAIVDAALSPNHTAVVGRGAFTRRISLTGLGVVSLGLVAATNVLDYYSRRTFMRAAHAIAHDIRIELYAHIQSLEFRELADANRGSYLALLHEDINRIELLFSSTWMMSRELSFALCSVVGFYLSHPGFAGMIATPMPGLLLVGQYLESRIRSRVDRARKSAAELGGTLSSALDGIETIRAFAREQTAIQWIDESSAEFRGRLDSTVDVTALYEPLAASAGHGLRVLTALVVGSYTGGGRMSTGNYVTLVLLSGMVALPLRGIARDLPHILSTLASVSQVFQAFELDTEEPEVGEPLDGSQVRGEIEFHGLDFAYPSGHRVFSGFSAQVPAGRISAFVGETGSGKSTLAKLLLRFHEPTGGFITLDGRQLCDLRSADVRRSISYIGQDIFLFNGTVAENIAFGQDHVDDELVVEAARAAEAHEFIEQLVDGYDTMVGERGQKLSGGQRQRVGIARALYAPRPIIILDEVTSALDAVTEANLYESLADKLAGRTVIVIAHRLSAVRSADRIHVLDAGEIIEAGSHDELLALEHGRYARFWALQTDTESL